MSGTLSRLYHGETAFDFVGRRRLWAALSGVVIVLGLVSLLTRGLNLGIEFEGGTSWEVEAPGVSVAAARDALRPVGIANAKIQTTQHGLRVQAAVDGSKASARDRDEVSRVLARVAGVPVVDVSVNEVGPSWGDEVTSKAQRALVLFLIVITVYITMRFEWKMALATLTALFHDLLVTVGVYSIARFEVTPATVIAILTILGYSIYDGIVVFDRVEENARGLAASGRITYGEMVNLSLNQVLMRTLNTSVTALLPIISLLVVGSWMLGASTLEEFGLALLIGLGASAYSSIFIASPVLAVLKEREPRYTAIRHRLAARMPVAVVAEPKATDASGASTPDPPPAAAVRPAARPPRRRRKRRSGAKR